jgi:hypothetical protein
MPDNLNLMKKNRLIFYAVFGAFHLFLVAFTIFIEANKNDFSFLTQMLKWMSLMKYGAFFGLILLISDVVWAYMINRDEQKEKSVVEQELNTLKAKLFDLQEAAAKQSSTRPANPNIKS